jgi:hypothetical protein
MNSRLLSVLVSKDILNKEDLSFILGIDIIEIKK